MSLQMTMLTGRRNQKGASKMFCIIRYAWEPSMNMVRCVHANYTQNIKSEMRPKKLHPYTYHEHNVGVVRHSNIRQCVARHSTTQGC